MKTRYTILIIVIIVLLAVAGIFIYERAYVSFLTDENVSFVIDGKSVTIDSAEFQDLMSLATLFYGLSRLKI